MAHFTFQIEQAPVLEESGFRFGDKGTHSSRTMMLSELEDLLQDVPPNASRPDYANAIIEDNILGKQTAATRRLSNQRLGEMYGLDRRLPLFRILLHLWEVDPNGRPLMALLVSLARDPLLRSTAASVINLPIGSELVRTRVLDALRDETGVRLNESSLDKVARNTGSTWTQSGHLEGRVRKIRKRVTPTVGPTALALWMGSLEGLAGSQLLDSHWVKILDRTGGEIIENVIRAKQLGLIHARIGGGVVEIDASRILDAANRRH